MMQVFFGNLFCPPYAEGEPFTLIVRYSDSTNVSFMACWNWSSRPGGFHTNHNIYGAAFETVLESQGSNDLLGPAFTARHDHHQIRYELCWQSDTLLPSTLLFQPESESAVVEAKLLPSHTLGGPAHEQPKLPFPIFISDVDTRQGDDKTEPWVLALPQGVATEEPVEVWGPTTNNQTGHRQGPAIVENLSIPSEANRKLGGFSFRWEDAELNVQFLPETGYLSFTTCDSQSATNPTDSTSSTATGRGKVSEICNLRPLCASASTSMELIVRPKTVVKNNTDPPEVVRVKIYDSETHVVEQVLMDVLSILPFVDIAAKVGKGLKLAAKGLEFFTKVLAANDLIFIPFELSEDKDVALYCGDKVARRPNREGKVLTNNDVIIERFRIDTAGGLTIQEYKKERAGEATYELREVFERGDALGFVVKNLYFRHTQPRRGHRLKNLKPADAAVSVESYNKADVTGCIYTTFPFVADPKDPDVGLLPHVDFHPGVLEKARTLRDAVFDFDQFADSYLVTSAQVDQDTAGFTTFQADGGVHIVQLNALSIEDGKGGYGHQLDGKFETLAKAKAKILEDLAGDPSVSPYAYCWRKSSQLWRTDQPPKDTKPGKIKEENQYSIRSHIGNYTFLVVQGTVVVPGPT